MGGKVVKKEKEVNKVVDFLFMPHNYEAQYNPKRQAKTVEINDEVVQIYVWEAPIRIWHWVNAICIFLLIITGIYIGDPFSLASPTTGAEGYFMGWVRIIHFICGFIFIAGIIYRLIWTFFGNRYTTFDIYKKGFVRGLFESMKFYMFLKNKKPHTIGHNAMAQLAYWVIFGGAAFVLIATGLYMYVEPQQGSMLAELLRWVPQLFNGSEGVRMAHHISMWVVIIFVVMHIYLAVREDYLVKNGTMSSIFTGWKTDKKKYVEDKKDGK